MLNNIEITPGSGMAVTADQSGADGSRMQVIKLAVSTLGDATLIPASIANGMTCDVTRVQGVVAVSNATPSNLKVDASGATVPISASSAIPVSAAQAAPAFVRLSDGTNPIATLPVSGTFFQATQPVSGTVAATQSGTWNIGTVASITGSVTVAGTVTANQGTAAALASGWPAILTDGTHPVGVATVSGAYALKVAVISTIGAASQIDETAFTEGAGTFGVLGGVYNDSIGNPTSGQAAAARITAYRAQHINLRNNGGTEIGTSSNPVRIDPTAGTTQPVSGTVTANQGATAWVDNLTQIGGSAVVAAAAGVLTVGVVGAAGAAFTQQAPLQTQNAPSGGTGGATQTAWKSQVTLAASQTTQAIHTPASGRTAYVEGIFLTVTTGTGKVQIYDGTNSTTTLLFSSTVTWAGLTAIITPSRPIPLSAVNNVLRYDTGSGVIGDLVCVGYDA